MIIMISFSLCFLVVIFQCKIAPVLFHSFFFFVYCFFITGCLDLAYLMSFIFFLHSWREFNYQLELSSPLLSTFVMNSSNFPKEKNQNCLFIVKIVDLAGLLVLISKHFKIHRTKFEIVYLYCRYSAACRWSSQSC